MAHSAYLSRLQSEGGYDDLVQRLYNAQNGKCFICGKDIDLSVQNVNVDHVKPLKKDGKDDPSNFALAHEHCNKTKLDADLNVAKILLKLEEIRKNVDTKEKATLADVLKEFGGSKYDFKYNIDGDEIVYSYNEMGPEIYRTRIYEDKLSGEKTAFIEVPIEYIYHDEKINPRGINNSISGLIKEFYQGNPQLHLSLGRIDDGKIKIFDGQHKAVAQIMLGIRKLVLRLFIDPDVAKLEETNTNAGSKLRQIAFDKSVIRQLHRGLLNGKIAEYQEAHNLKPDEYSFSEQDLVEYFKGDRANIKQYIINSQKDVITNGSKLCDYIDREGRGKSKPISYSAFEKTLLSIFINSKTILNTPMDAGDDDNPRVLESTQLIHLCDILADAIYVGKFDVEVGTNKIEEMIVKQKDKDITDEHLIAYRVSKEEIMINWLRKIVDIMNSYFLATTGGNYNKENLFQQKIPDQLWTNIENFVKNFAALPLWRDRALAETIFSGKNRYEYWATIFNTGKTPDGTDVLAEPLNFQNMLG